MSTSVPSHRTSLLLLVIFILFTAGIGWAGYLYYLDQRRTTEAEERHQLTAIAEMKVSQVVAWRTERLSDARMILSNGMMMPSVSKVLDGTADSATREAVRVWMRQLCDLYYANALLVDAQGRLRLNEGQGPGAQEHYAGLVREVMEANDVVFRDFHQDAGLAVVHLGLNIPLRMPGGKPIGALLLGIDPRRYLYPMIQSWPTPSPSAESLLVRREGEEVLFLNELRHQKGTALRLRFPLTDLVKPAVQAALGKEGILEGVNYRGHPVLAVAQKVPDSPWNLVAMVDQAEVYAPLRRNVLFLALTVSSLVAAVGAGVGLVWRQLRSNSYRQKYEAELERRALLEHYEHLTRHANDIILLLDEPSGRIIDANERAASCYGYSTAELVGMHARELCDPATLLEFETDWKAAEQAGGLILESRHRRRDGTTFPVELSIRVISVEGRKFRQSIIRDISERKAMERNLRDSENRFRQLVEGAPDGIFVQTALRFRYLNPAALRLFGARTSDEIIGQLVTERIHPDNRDMVAERIRILNQERRAVPRLEQVYLKVDGTPFEVEVSAVPFSIENEDGAVVFFCDIGQRKKAEKERAMLEEQFLQAQKMESVGRLAGGVAHDFNNHLTIINGYCDLLLKGREPSHPEYEPLDEIRRAGERAASLTRQLLAFSRKQVLDPKPMRLNEAVSELETMLRRLLGEDIELVIRLAHGLNEIMADAGQMHQLIMNLVVNARDAMPNGGRLTIETENVEVDEAFADKNADARAGSFVVLTVTDNGVGMDPETMRRIFEPFFTTKRSGAGTGLGLSTVYGIVKQSGGWIIVTSAPGSGTAFKIYLPNGDPQTRVVDPDNQAENQLSGSETLLVVEDQVEVLDLTERILKGYGYEVLSASSGGEALGLCGKFDRIIHLMITDVVMPGMTGRELATRLAQVRPETKVLYISGYTADVIAHQGVLDAGVAYLPKPFSPEGLARKVREILAG